MNLSHDIRFGLRVLAKSPGFAATAILTIGLGIGATTSIYSVCDALLWKPVPLPSLDTLAIITERGSSGTFTDWNSVTPGDLADVSRDNVHFSSLAAWGQGLANLVGTDGEPQRVGQALVTANFFDVAGVKPAIGRAVQAGEDEPGREREVSHSDPLWKRSIGGDASVLGRTVRFDDENYTIIGVMPESYQFPRATDVWTPYAMPAERRASRTAHSMIVMGRLKPGATVQAANADLERIAARLAQAYPASNTNRKLMVWPSMEFLVDPFTRRYLRMLLGAVLFVLLIACVNVANLQFARATGRLREVAVRTALGASRWRVVGQLVTESVMLALAGAGLGLVLAREGVRLMKDYMPADVRQYIMGWDTMSIDGRALLFTLAAAVAAGILSGLAPAWQCSRPNLAESLKEGGRGGTASRSRHRLRNILVTSEITLAVVLLVGAGLMVRGFRSLVDAGDALEPATLVKMRLALTAAKYPEKTRVAAFYRQVLERVNAIPGVRSATVVSAMPYSNHSSGQSYTIEGRPEEPGRPVTGMLQSASASYFPTIHVPLKAGRLLAASDGPDAPPVAVISQQMAAKWWGKESPLGRRMKIGGASSKNPWMTIVGVVGDVTHNPYDRGPRPIVYVPFEQTGALWMDVGVRAAGDPLRLVPAITAAIRSVDPEQPVTEVETMAQAIHSRAIGLNYMAALMGTFGFLALALSAVGVYGVMAHLVNEETHEIGVRMALGASRGSVLAQILRRGMTTTGIGLAVGLPIAYGFARLMESLIFGVSATDAASFVAIPLALVAAAAVAVLAPAHRATKIDPIVALRYE
jgi:putative ABC transport system permease protein